MNTLLANAQQGMEQLAHLSREHKGIRNAAIVAGAGLGVYAAYHALKPERHYDTGKNYFDIIRGMDDVVKQAAPEAGYVMMGGGAAAALMDSRTVIDIENKRIVAPQGIHKDQFREDDGTMADIDVLVFDIDRKLSKEQKQTGEDEPITSVTRIRDALEEAFGTELKIGVTGLHDAKEYGRRHDPETKRFIENIKNDWVGDRIEGMTVAASYDGRVLKVEKSRFFAIADVMTELPDEYFEPWDLMIIGEDGIAEKIPVFHPLIQVLCYASRASHGIRPRDVEKVTRIMNNIGPHFDGAHLEWGKKQQTANVALVHPIDDDGVLAAIDFVNQKNKLRWSETHKRMGVRDAAWMAARVAIHRKLDTWKFTTQFGRGGWLFDNVIAPVFSGEKQDKQTKATPIKKAA